MDQGPLTALLARAMDALAPGSLVALRFPSALAAGSVVLLTGLLAREFGARRAAQLFAAACMAVAAVLLAVGHLLSTTTLDLLAWTALSWLLVRALRGGGPIWLAVGALAGVALENKWQPAFLLAAVAVAVLAVGPRRVFASWWPYLGGLLAALLWAPNLLWQASAGWPQLAVARAIAGGSSGTSEPWYLFLPYQLVLVSPVLVPVWVAGLVRLARDPGLRYARAFPVAYGLLGAGFLVTGGKPYYLAGLYPVLLAAGADPTLRWAGRGSARVRRGLLAAALVLSAAVSTVLFLPVLPVRALATTPVLAVNYDAGETVGWPQLASTVADVSARVPTSERPTAVVLTRNYGEAGALVHYRTRADVPPVYSGHNSYAAWGPPPESATTAIVVGYSADQLRPWFGAVTLAATFDNGVGVPNDEQHAPIWLCEGRSTSWADIWPALRHVG